MNNELRALLQNIADGGYCKTEVMDDLRALLATPACNATSADGEQWYADTPDGDSALVTRVAALCSHPSMSFHQVALLEGAISESAVTNKPAAQPVPPADGEIERLDVEMLKGGTWRLASTPDGLMVRYENHLAHICQLQAEVERLNRVKMALAEQVARHSDNCSVYRAELDALKAAQVDVRPVAYMRNEGTPNNLVKCTFTCPGAFGVYRHPAHPQGEPVAPHSWSYKLGGEQRFYPTDPRKADFGGYAELMSDVEPLYRHPAEQPAPVAVVDERAEFVAWVRQEWPQAPLSYVRDLLPKDDPRYGEYCDETLQRAWVGWQARARLNSL
ncbi:hypothetical protein ACCM60_14045 [Pseudomonas chlororaphis subsp. aureofaciens]|uniref:hypothetical protein n=1 Tax=Pseudomonas chlororaphis TaxID=587753 RepID=UPI003555D542